MSEASAARSEMRSGVGRIEARVQVGASLLAASDDPLFLGLRGPDGREFRLLLAHGKSLRRKADDRFVLGPPSDAETNVHAPDLNDPTAPPLDASRIEGAYLRKGLEPIPNVRAVGEMDDRLELLQVEITLRDADGAVLERYGRRGPVWLGLNAGMVLELARLDEGG